MSVGILGNGEIGSALHRVYELAGVAGVVTRDPFLGINNSLSDCDLVNVCIPFGGYDEFLNVLQNLELRSGCFVIIQSTTEVGCTDRLQNDLPSLVCVHSPVRGVHPDLTKGLLTFDKYVGISDRFFHDDSAKSFVARHTQSLNMKPVVCRAKESELAKVVSTTLYGLNIAAITDVSQLCKDHAVDFEKVFTQWQTTYNAGYTALGKSNVCRPVLTPVPENEEGRRVIGGHCVIPNCAILNKRMGEKNLTNFVLRYSDKKSLDHCARSKSEINMFPMDNKPSKRGETRR